MAEKFEAAFLDIIGFFGVLLPGAVLLFLQGDLISHLFLDGVGLLGREVESWILFLIVSYFLGHLLYEVGTGLTHLRNMLRQLRKSEDTLYNAVKKINKLDYEQLKENDKESPSVEDEPEKSEGTDKQAKSKNKWFQGVDSQYKKAKIRNRRFQRAFSFVLLKSPDAVVAIDREGAGYKLFRSLTVVFLFDLVISFFVWALAPSDPLYTAFFHPFSSPGIRMLFSALSMLVCFVRFWSLQNTAERLTFEYLLMLKK